MLVGFPLGRSEQKDLQRRGRRPNDQPKLQQRGSITRWAWTARPKTHYVSPFNQKLERRGPFLEYLGNLWNFGGSSSKIQDIGNLSKIWRSPHDFWLLAPEKLGNLEFRPNKFCFLEQKSHFPFSREWRSSEIQWCVGCFAHCLPSRTSFHLLAADLFSYMAW